MKKKDSDIITLSRTERQLLLYDIFLGCRKVEFAEITGRLPVGMRMLQRDIADLTAAGLICVKYSRQEEAYVKDGAPVFSQKASGRYREHLVRLNRLGRLMTELWQDEISLSEPYERSVYSSCSDIYHQLFPDCSERTRQRDFAVLNRIGYVIRYIPELSYYAMWEHSNLREDFGVFREEGKLMRRTEGYNLEYEASESFYDEVILLKEIALLKERGTAWMIRCDGKAIPVVQHIYASREEAEETLYAAEWLYQNTGRKRVKKDVLSFILAWAFSCGADESTLVRVISEQIESRPYIFLTKEFIGTVSHELQALFQKPGAVEVIRSTSLDAHKRQVEEDLNREFMRARYGGLYNTEDLWCRDMYFRISSDDYDWGAVILRFMKNAFFSVDTVTVVWDEESTGMENGYYMAADGRAIDHMDWEEFLEGCGTRRIL